jgi:hypothetical protein
MFRQLQHAASKMPRRFFNGDMNHCLANCTLGLIGPFKDRGYAFMMPKPDQHVISMLVYAAHTLHLHTHIVVKVIDAQRIDPKRLAGESLRGPFEKA